MNSLTSLQINNDPIIAAAILAGGESRRMGSPKALLPWQNTSLIDHHVMMANQQGFNTLVCSDRYDYSTAIQGKYTHIHDTHSQQGPLAAIAGAMHFLKLSSAPLNAWLAVISVDSLLTLSELMTLLNDKDTTHTTCAKKTVPENANIIYVQDVNDDAHYPLIGFYHMGLFPALEDYLMHGQRRVMGFINAQPYTTLTINTDAWNNQLNINTPADYQSAMATQALHHG